MNRRDAHRLARTLMDENGLEGWKIEWMNSARTAGQCVYWTRTLRFSSKLFEVWAEDRVRNTITHEMAHALVGPSADAHGYKWQAQHRALGGTGDAKWNDEDASRALAKYIGTCPNGHQKFRQAKSEKMFRISCGKCSSVYNPRYHFTWTENNARGVTPVAANTVRTTTAPAPRPIQHDKGFTSLDDLFGTGD